MDVKKERNSNHELMRIISMFFIVLGHVLLFSDLLNTPNKTANMVYYFLEFILIIHVNSYVLVSGYYQSNSKFKQSKLWQIINCSWFYRVLMLIVFSVFGIISVNKVQVFKDLLPVTLDNYWFIKDYILLYCLSPFLNKFIKSIDKRSFQKLLIVGFIIFSIIPNITGGEFFANNGYTLYNFIYLYLIGAYLRIYPIDKSYFFRIFSKEAFRIIMVIVFISCVFLNYVLYFYSKQITGFNDFFDLSAYYISSSSIAYSNPIIIIQTIAYFSFFSTLSFHSKFVNKCSSLMLGVYMIHENRYVRANLYKWLGLLDGKYHSVKFVLCVFGATILIFVVCAIIEWLRQILFKFIYNRKCSQKIRSSYYTWISKIHLNNDTVELKKS